MCRVSSVKHAVLFQPLLSLSPPPPSPGDDVLWQASVSSCGDQLSLSPCDVSVPFPWPVLVSFSLGLRDLQ